MRVPVTLNIRPLRIIYVVIIFFCLLHFWDWGAATLALLLTFDIEVKD